MDLSKEQRKGDGALVGFAFILTMHALGFDVEA